MNPQRVDVVIIEDDVWLGEQMERTLKAAGFTTQRTTNGPAAMELIDETMPRALLLDMLLPGGTGLTLMHELQSYQDTGKIPVVLCTNLAANIEPEDVWPYGVRRILDKTTMLPEDIVASVRGVLL